MQEENKKNERVIVYIDGFNLYFGMREAGFDHCRWLNLKKLIENLCISYVDGWGVAVAARQRCWAL